jgi:hypothetical protein
MQALARYEEARGGESERLVSGMSIGHIPLLYYIYSNMFPKFTVFYTIHHTVRFVLFDHTQ